MKDILDTIISRRSIKSFLPDMPSEESINKILTAGTYAPTGKNMQSPIILAITNKKVRDNLSKENARLRGIDFDPFYGAPVVLAVLAKKEWFTYIYDGSCVMENMLLEAHSLDLGACWIHHAKQVFETDYGKNILKSLNITDEYEGIGFCIVGKPKVKPIDNLPRKNNYIYYIQ